MKQEPDKIYEISSEFFDSFKVKIRKGKLIWCSDDSHPVGCDWKSLRDHYESKIVKCYVKEINEDFGNP